MTEWAPGPIHVVAPASSANLGPGFDALGLALSMYDELTGEVVDDGLDVIVEGVGAEELTLDESHLVVSSMRATFNVLGVSPPGLRLRCRNVVPHGMGLGSSAAAIVGGIVLARALVLDGVRRLDDAAVLGLAARIEGHHDNVAAAICGGMTIALADDDARGIQVARVELRERLGVVVFVPPAPVPTSLARGLLPENVPHRAAAANAGRAALLVAAVQGDRAQLFVATRDELHQHYREPAMPQSYAFMSALRDRGVPAIISGAGPAVLAFAVEPFGGEELSTHAPAQWRAHVLDVDTAGARVVAGAVHPEPDPAMNRSDAEGVTVDNK